jgi:hypothetical protein
MTITWKIEQLDRLTSDGFVTTAHWRATAVDGEYSASAYGTTGWQAGTPEIPYANLTEATVLAWVWENLDKAATEANLTAQIDALKNPTTANGVPW